MILPATLPSEPPSERLAPEGVARAKGGAAPFVWVTLFALLYLAPLGVRPLQTPDELRYAEIAREMSASGEWIVPHLDGLRYLEKPPLGYWLIAGAAGLVGKGAFAARLPSALATGLTALAIGVLLGSTGQSRRAQSLTIALFLTSVGVYALGTAAILDPLFSATLTGAMVCGYLAWQTPREGGKVAALLGAGVLSGLAFLAKGLLALALPAVTFGPFLLWQRDTRGLLRLCWVPLVTFFAVTLPWALEIHSRAPDFWTYFVEVQHLERFASADAEHARPFWFLVPYLPGALLPWILLLPAAVSGLRGMGRHALIRFSVCAVLGPLLLLSSSRGKLGTYVLPQVPFLAVILGVGLARATSAAGALHRLPARLLGLGCLAAALWLGADATFGLQGIVSKIAPDLRLGVVAVAVALAGAAFLRSSQLALGPAFRWFGAGAVCLALCIPWVVRGGQGRFAPAEFVASARAEIPTDAALAADTACLYAIGFVLDRSDVYLIRPGELEYPLRFESAKQQLWGEDGLRRELVDPDRDRDVAVCLTTDRFDRLRDELPAPTSVKTSRELVVAVFAAPRAGSAAAASLY